MLGFFGLDYRITMGSVAVISAMAIAGPVCAQTRNFDIRAQSAAQSRPIFAKQVGIQILANGNGVRAKWTDAVRGSMSVDNAPRKHLSGAEENGATLIWPGSYGDRALVDDGEGAMIFAAAEPGYAIVFLASMLHGARGSRSPGVRRGIIVSYGLGWPKSYENQYPTYPPPIAGGFAIR